MYCRKCGTNIPDDSVFCPKCGISVTEESEPEQDIETQADTDNVSSEKVNSETTEPKAAKNDGKKKQNRKKTALSIVKWAVGLSVFFAVALVLFFQAGPCFEYKLVDDDHYVITKYTGTFTEVTIPDTIWFKPVTSISENAFNKSGATRVKLGKNLTEIGKGAFDNCNSLEELDCSAVEMANGSNFLIANSAFKGCHNLKKVILPDTGIAIGERAFADCTALEEIVTFEHNSNGYSAVIGVFGKQNVIAAQAFQNCTALKSLALEYANLGSSAFEGCTGLTELWMDGGSLNDYGISSGTFKGCSGLKSAQIFFSRYSEHNTSIPRECFADCYSLESFSGSDVSEIGELAFRYCRSLSDLSFDPYPSDISNTAFVGCPNIQTDSTSSTESTPTVPDTTQKTLTDYVGFELAKMSYKEFTQTFGMPDEYYNGKAIYNVGEAQYCVNFTMTGDFMGSSDGFNANSIAQIEGLEIYGGTDVDISYQMHLGEPFSYYDDKVDFDLSNEVYMGAGDHGSSWYEFGLILNGEMDYTFLLTTDSMKCYGVKIRPL